MPKFRRKSCFIKMIQENHSLDVFLHDSDHSLEWQEFELKHTLKHARNIGLIIMDDINPQTLHLIESDQRSFSLFLIQEANKKVLVAVKSD
jgi:citrate lyase synthetase